MKMRVYGFAWHPDHIPADVPAVTVFERIEQVSGQEFGDYMGAATKIGDWWAGVLLKIRDPKAITKLKEENGVLVVSAEKLEEGERLAETNFFLAHESNGHGLYCHHYMSASLLGDFGYYCSHRFHEIRKTKLEAALATNSSMKASQLGKLKKRYAGRLMIEQVLKPGTFDAHIKALKEITRVEANLVSFQIKESFFKPLTTLARRKRVILGYDDQAPAGVIANAVSKSRKEGLIEKATVYGKDNAGGERIYRTSNDSQVFEEYEYADIVSSLTLRFDDMSSSIQNSEITKKLVASALIRGSRHCSE